MDCHTINEVVRSQEKLLKIIHVHIHMITEVDIKQRFEKENFYC